ncbi:hypothetical protein KDD17_11280 [Sulfitobacter albidus]|uniref:Calcium-binding protein n=1 Tax=Sulfitobacter albidus TaxID=2829501 RepID=A0A975PL92_9RHOB|nr:hypothetical protein [Sulfitobacter albidus]QUJ75542.1 hypothetical protein KDD17_11280 [Sulfitobacter albidus]
MTPLALLALLGLTLFIPVFTGSTEDEAQDVSDEAEETEEPEGEEMPGTPAEPEETEEPVVLEETPDPDPERPLAVRTAGDDFLSGDVGEGERIDGGAGDDTINVASEFTRGLAVGTISGGAGDDEIYAQRSFVRVEGGDGNDTITGDSADDGGGTPIFGDAGDDFLILTNSPAFKIGAVADGGAGDDTIRVDLFFFGDGTFDTLTGGTGDDVFELPAPEGFGVIGTITDFEPGEDVLFLIRDDPREDDPEPQITLVQNTDEGSTDVVLTFDRDTLIDAAPTIIRLEGAPAITLDDIIIGTPGGTDVRTT